MSSERTGRAGEAGSGTVPGDVIGAGGVTGGPYRAAEPKAPPASEAQGNFTPGPEAAAAGGQPSGKTEEDTRPREGAFGETIREHSVTPEARWGVDSGSPGGGIASSTSAQQVAEREEDES